MANFHKYVSESAYNSAQDRAAGQSHISCVNNSNIHYDGCNVVVPYRQFYCAVGDIVVYDNSLGKYCVIKQETLNISNLDQSRYSVIGIYFASIGGKGRILSLNTVQEQWAINRQYYKLGIDFNTVLPAIRWNYFGLSSGDISFPNNNNLQDVADAINNATVELAGCAQVVNGSYIAITLDVPHGINQDFYLSNYNGSTVVDYFYNTSKNTTYQGNPLSNIVRYFAQQSANVVCDGLYDGTTQSCYAKNDYDLNEWSGLNLNQSLSYWQVNGVSYFVQDYDQETMNEQTFNDLSQYSAGSDERNLYDKYDGNWEKYIANRMMDVFNPKTDGVNYFYFDNGLKLTNILAQIECVNDADVLDHPYRLAWSVFQIDLSIVGAESGKWSIPTPRELAMILEDNNLNLLNDSLTVLGGNLLDVNIPYATIAEFDEENIWMYNPDGLLGYNMKDNPFICQPCLELDFDTSIILPLL